eukprot:m51a1_g11088 hypothetical protein (117) ;mRNA; f:11968-12371
MELGTSDQGDGVACDKTLLVVLFSQAMIFSFPAIWCLRRVCRTWRSIVESSFVLSSHAEHRERISKLRGVARTSEGLRDILLADHILDVIGEFETRSFSTSGLRHRNCRVLASGCV